MVLPPGKVQPPRTGIYHAAFPHFCASEDCVSSDSMASFEALAGKRIAWAYFSCNRITPIIEVASDLRTIASRGSIPFLRLCPHDQAWPANPPGGYPLDALIDGREDDSLRVLAGVIRDAGGPVMVEFGTEINGTWSPWNGRWNGAGNLSGYGDPAEADGPERFRDAFRHIVQVFDAEAARNVTWCFHFDARPDITDAWNDVANYYPGDQYVDWIGVSVFGAQRPEEARIGFTEILDPVYPVLAGLSATRPLGVFEFGVCDSVGTDWQSVWIRDALLAVRAGRYPRVKAMAYWHETWTNPDGSISRLRIDASAEARQAYADGIASSVFIERAE